MRLQRLGPAAVLALFILAAPIAGDAQPPAKIPRIGLLDYAAFWEPFLRGLRELGYVEGQSIAIEYRSTEGRSDRLPELAAELVRHKVDVIVTYGTHATRVAKQATTTIPIVMAAVGDPVRAGLVASLARPGGNVTGLTQIGPELGGKRLQLLKEALPKLSRVAFLWNPDNQSNVVYFNDLSVASRALGTPLQSAPVRSPDDFESVFAAIIRARPDALIVTADPVIQLYMGRVIHFAVKNQLPTIFNLKENVEAGGLMSYGANVPELLRRAAIYVDKILKGTKPADLPVEQPTRFELVINLKTAKALGLKIPESVLIRADHVIQ